MKYIAVILVILFALSLALPLYAEEKSTTDYADKIRENNKKIATFVADTFKLPYVLLGDGTGHNHDEVVGETQYEGHEYLQELPERLQGEGKAVK